MKRRLAIMLLLVLAVASTAVAGKRIRNYSRDGTGPAEAAYGPPRRVPLEAGGNPGDRWVKATLRLSVEDAVKLFAENADLEPTAAHSILASSLDYAGGELPVRLQVTIEIRQRLWP